MLSVIIAASCVSNDFKNYRDRLYAIFDISFLSLGSRMIFCTTCKERDISRVTPAPALTARLYVKSEIISTSSANGCLLGWRWSRRTVVQVVLRSRPQPHQSGSYMQMHVGYTTWPHSISCHQRSDAIQWICIPLAAPRRRDIYGRVRWSRY